MSTSPITAFQAEIAQVFFSLPETKSFLLAGGLALAAHGISERPTEDFDAFTSKAPDVTTAFEAFTAAAGDRGWSIRVVQTSDTFVRLEVVGEDSLLVDLAGRKLLALFDRAMPRDFVDVYRLAQRWETGRLLEWATAIDAGFDLTVLVAAMRQLDGFADPDLPINESEIDQLRAFFRTWIEQLEAGGTEGE